MEETSKQVSQALKTGVVMDPISGIKPYKDSSFAMLLEAQRRGHVLYYMEPNDLYAVDGRVFARMQKLEVRDNTSDWFTLTPLGSLSLDELDIVLMCSRIRRVALPFMACQFSRSHFTTNFPSL